MFGYNGKAGLQCGVWLERQNFLLDSLHRIWCASTKNRRPQFVQNKIIGSTFQKKKLDYYKSAVAKIQKSIKPRVSTFDESKAAMLKAFLTAKSEFFFEARSPGQKTVF